MRYAVASITLYLVGILAGCSNRGSLTNPFPPTPSSVVKAFYMSCNAGEYSKAEETLSSDSKKMIHGDLGGLVGGIKGVCDKSSQQGAITSIDIKSENIRGEGAVVMFDVHFKNSTKPGEKEDLIKENGAWKISPGGG